MKADKKTRDLAKEAGVSLNGPVSYVMDNEKTKAEQKQESKKRLEIMDIKEALKKYSWLKGYMWKLVKKDKDKYTKSIAKSFDGGYFIRIFKNQKIDFPIQACMLIKSSNYEQKVHNIIIAEENSSAHIINGCASEITAAKPKHYAVSEYYIEKNAKLMFTMVHSWNKETKVRPRTAVTVGDNASYVSNYITTKEVDDIQSYPVVYCNGTNSKAYLNSILFAKKSSFMDIGSELVLNGANSSGEIISRTIAKDSAEIIARGRITGNNNTAKGHLECMSLLIGDKAKTSSIPELKATKQCVLSHEAAVGKLADREIEYIMSRGVPEDEAKSILIRGFLDTKILHLPENITKAIDSIIKSTVE